jgi:hypothetical protein
MGYALVDLQLFSERAFHGDMQVVLFFFDPDDRGGGFDDSGKH